MQLSPSPCAGVEPSAHAADCLALCDLAAATEHHHWRRKDGWLRVGTPHCAWLGVGCDADGRVMRLELDLNGLQGELPPSLVNLTQLRTLCVLAGAHAARCSSATCNLTRTSPAARCATTRSRGPCRLSLAA